MITKVIGNKEAGLIMEGGTDQVKGLIMILMNY